MSKKISEKVDALYHSYAQHFTQEQVAQIILQSLLLQMTSGKIYDSLDAIKESIGNAPDEYKMLLNTALFDKWQALAIYEEASKFDLSRERDDLGEVFEYLISRADAQRLGQFYTPPTLANLLIKICMLGRGDEPLSIYDPAMGTAGLLVLAQKYLKRDDKFYGQEFNSTSWKIALINALLNGMKYDFGSNPCSTFICDIHANQKMDIILANPPYNQKSWDDGIDILKDSRFKDMPHPPSSNGNFAWILHCLHHLKNDGIASIVIANGSLTTMQKDELVVRKYLVEHDLVEAVISLPPKLFTTTSISACVWVINKAKKKKGHILFVDIASEGKKISRNQNELDILTIDQVVDTIGRWRNGEEIGTSSKYVDKSIEDTKERNYNLAPGQYQEVVVDKCEMTEESFVEKMTRLIYEFDTLSDESEKLTKRVRENLSRLRWENEK